MAVGAKHTTDTGVIQIDENFACHCLRYTGTATVVTRHEASLNSSAWVAKTVDITVTADAPIFAIHGPGEYGVISTTQDGSTWKFRVIGYDHAPTFTYFIYDTPPPTPSASGVGYEVKDANGVVKFSSLYRTMEVAAYFQSTSSASINPNRQYATAFGSRIELEEASEHFTNQEIWTFWTYRLSTASAIGSLAVADNHAIAGGAGQGGWSPVYPSGALNGWGADTDCLVIDVTDIVGTPVTPGGPTVSVNATSRTVNGTGSGTTTTDAVTASASGGSAPYNFQWDKIGGDPSVVAFGATNTASLRTQFVNQPSGTDASSRWICRVTDNAGRVAFSPEVTMTHVQGAADFVPNAFAPFDLLQVQSNDPDVSWFSGARQITGITQPINLRFERYNYSGNLSALHVDVFTGPSASGPWTHHGYYNAHDAGARYLNVTGVTNGMWIAYNAHAITSSGMKSASVDFVVWNLSNPGGSVQITSRAGNTFKVDADNNFNVAPTPDPNLNPIDWANCSFTTNDSTGSGSNAARTISGINQSVNLRFTLSNVSTNFNGGDFYINKNGAWSRGATGFGNGFWTDVDVVNGDSVYFYFEGSTTSGRKTLTGTITVTNTTTGAVVDTFTISGVVDNDNNYNVVPVTDNTMNSVSLSAVNAGSADWEVGAGYGFTVSGINVPIFLKWTISNYVSNGMDTLLDIYVNGAFTYRTAGGNGHWSGVTVNNGDSIYVNHYVNTNSGRRQATYNVTMTNDTANQNFGTYSVSLIADSDNNYNVTPAPTVTLGNSYDFQHVWASWGEWTAIGAYPNPTVTGGTAPYSYSWVRTSGRATPISSTEKNPYFWREQQANWSDTGSYDLTVTDALGKKATATFYYEWNAGDAV